MRAFTKELSVGNRMIDYAHREIFSTINGIVGLIAEKNRDVLSEAFITLENCLCAYFAVEESIARTVNFNFINHMLAHQNLLNEFQCVRDELIAKNGELSKFEQTRHINYLKNCFIRHIREDAKPLKIILNMHFYDLKPNGTNDAATLSTETKK
jgi:hemerythrin-like metal-binding protein